MHEITQYQQPSNDIEVIQRTAKLLAASGYFDTAQDMTQAIAQIGTQIMAGAEMGMGPFTAVQSIHIIKGKPTMSANAMAAAVKAHPKYDYRLRKNDDACVTIEFFQGGESLGVSTFTAADAKRAGTGNMGKYPRNMLFARAMSNGVRWHCPDVFMGNAVYTADELGAPSHEESQPDPEPDPEPEDIDIDMDEIDEIPFGHEMTPKDMEIASWDDSPEAAKVWADQFDVFENYYQRDNSFANVVKDLSPDGKPSLKAAMLPTVFSVWYDKVIDYADTNVSTPEPEPVHAHDDVWQ